jgi:hypothetical protein
MPHQRDATVRLVDDRTSGEIQNAVAMRQAAVRMLEATLEQRRRLEQLSIDYEAVASRVGGWRRRGPG